MCHSELLVGQRLIVLVSIFHQGLHIWQCDKYRLVALHNANDISKDWVT